jgi:DNA primase
LLEYPQKTAQAESKKVLDFFLQPELKILGGKIVEAYKLLGFVDINIILSADEDKPLLERINRLMMETLPSDDNTLEKNFTDNIRRIKEKWYKEQHRQLKLKLAQAQERGNEELLKKLMYEKQNLMTQEKELR